MYSLASVFPKRNDAAYENSDETGIRDFSKKRQTLGNSEMTKEFELFSSNDIGTWKFFEQTRVFCKSEIKLVFGVLRITTQKVALIESLQEQEEWLSVDQHYARWTILPPG